MLFISHLSIFLYMEHTSNDINASSSIFDFFVKEIESGNIKPTETTIPDRKIYSDLEIACLLAHKRGEYGPMMTFITNDHPLMVEAGISHDFASMHGQIIHQFR